MDGDVRGAPCVDARDGLIQVESATMKGDGKWEEAYPSTFWTQLDPLAC